MKKTLIFAALLLAGTGCMAQKANVRKARNLALAENADFAGARTAIKEALQDETTKNQTETWYLAGLIGYEQNKRELQKLQLGTGGKDFVLRGEAVLESYRYWLVADSLSQVPTYDKKGNPKYDTRTRKQIAERMVDYYIHQELINYAVEMNEKKMYDKAYDAFHKYVMLPDLAMMQDKKLQERMPRDTNYYIYKYYAGRMAYQAQMYTEAMRIFSELVEGDIEAVSAGEFLYQCYIDLNDSVKANEVLDHCIQRFPAEAWFIQNRINNLVNNGSMEAAVDYLDRAIAADPQVQYFISKGSILNLQKKFDEAIATYEQALKVDPTNAAIYENYGYVYVDMGNKLNDDAAYLNAKDYAKAKIEIDNAFRKALPYFEKAYELAPDNYDYKRSLRQLYYRLGEETKYQQLAD